MKKEMEKMKARLKDETMRHGEAHRERMQTEEAHSECLKKLQELEAKYELCYQEKIALDAKQRSMEVRMDMRRM